MNFIELISLSKKRYDVKHDSVLYTIIFLLSKKIKNKTDFLLDGETDIDFRENKYWKKLDEYYLKNKPLAHITKQVKFLGLNLKVERGILAPRNETEIVTQKAIALLTSSSINRHPIVYDLCCGTGNMGLAIKKYLPQARVTCVDINPLAIRNTNINAKRNNLKIKTITGDFYEAIKEKVDCIICNPPYVNEKELDKHMLHYEDKISFTNAKNDLYFYKKIISNYEKIMNNNFLIVFEIGHKQKTRLKAILKKYQLEKYSKFYKDYNQKDRILIIQYHFF